MLSTKKEKKKKKLISKTEYRNIFKFSAKSVSGHCASLFGQMFVHTILRILKDKNLRLRATQKLKITTIAKLIL